MSRSERRNKTKLIQVRCTPEEHGMIVNSAEAACLTVGEYVRRIALRRKIQPVTDYKMIMALSRLGGLQKHLFMQGHRADSKEYSEILTELKRTILRVDGALPRYVV
ncbi:plasmid mobilization protein MobA [Klebsiella pneumoniae]|uniref:plasmid mobilization protein MobA n=1 Tax=Klebsiella pneumoniae TaxID=573 RepID=UPI00108381BE|nr:plasmid mobilization protein MobA [Klebsiella pneumoniae]VFZ98148.1 conjugal transfer relaxosome component TraJ [Klebsiella pneumoniae]HBQ8799602.1 mobilization protein [Klebsiella pneumoniae]HDY9000588.1 mobilization protein [Klebsiella pneumoniae]